MKFMKMKATIFPMMIMNMIILNQGDNIGLVKYILYLPASDIPWDFQMFSDFLI